MGLGSGLGPGLGPGAGSGSGLGRVPLPLPGARGDAPNPTPNPNPDPNPNPTSNPNPDPDPNPNPDSNPHPTPTPSLTPTLSRCAWARWSRGTWSSSTPCSPRSTPTPRAGWTWACSSPAPTPRASGSRSWSAQPPPYPPGRPLVARDEPHGARRCCGRPELSRAAPRTRPTTAAAGQPARRPWESTRRLGECMHMARCLQPTPEQYSLRRPSLSP